MLKRLFNFSSRSYQKEDFRNHKSICAKQACEGSAAKVSAPKVSNDCVFMFQIKEVDGTTKVCENFDEIPKKENVIKEVHLSIPSGSTVDLMELKRALENLIKRSRESLESLTFDDGNFSGKFNVSQCGKKRKSLSLKKKPRQINYLVISLAQCGKVL